MKKSDYKKFIDTQNYFKVYEEFKIQLGNYTKRSQVSMFIIIEFLRNLKVYSSRITEIINDFTDYLKLNNKWKKFNENEITFLFLGINKGDLHDDYFDFIFSENNKQNQNSFSSLSEKSRQSSSTQKVQLIQLIHLVAFFLIIFSKIFLMINNWMDYFII